VFVYAAHHEERGWSTVTGSFRFSGEQHSFDPVVLERVRRSITLLSPRQPSGLDREAAMALIEELQRMQSKDRRVTELIDQISTLIDAAREENGAQ
jgi:hypothetical protein